LFCDDERFVESQQPAAYLGQRASEGLSGFH
jgi:hypothetical protein